ncbi:MAG: DUF4177 domain-containing protein [Rhodobacteraceae bacterium]|nr:DUF4177 domain-containing protein [Paracoccaceae bacterium]
MPQFEYKVVPAPTRGDKVKGVKQPEARFAHSVEGVLNRMAEGGWEFVRAEMLPNEERSGLSKTTREWRNLLIFRRERAAADTIDPALIAAPVPPAQSGAKLAARHDTHDAARAEPAFAEDPASYDMPDPEESDTKTESEGADDKAGAGSPIPLRPLRGWRDRD